MAGMTTLMIGALALGAAGTGIQMIGAQQQAGIARQQEAQRRRAMELDARRRQMEVLRNMQRAQAMALVTNTAQGAQYGSNLMGAYGQIAGVGGTNQSGILQNLEIGRNMFDLNAQMSDAQSFSAMGKGFQSLGGQLFNAMGAMGRLEGGGWNAFKDATIGRYTTDFGWNRANWDRGIPS